MRKATFYTATPRGALSYQLASLALLAPLCIRWLFARGARGARGAEGLQGYKSSPSGWNLSCLRVESGGHLPRRPKCARGGGRVSALSYIWAMSHRQSRIHAQSARIPGGETQLRYVKAEVVHTFSAAATGMCHKRFTTTLVYTLDSSYDSPTDNRLHYDLGEASWHQSRHTR
jgi:hypothetical protein